MIRVAYHQVQSIVDQHLTQDMANFQLSRNLVSVGYYVNVEMRSSIAHSHPYYEFILVRKGVCEYFSNGSSFSLHPDEMLILSPGTVHTMICPEDASSYERLILQIDAEFAAQILAGCAAEGGGENMVPLAIIRADAVCRWGLRELIERINATASVTDSAMREKLYRHQIAELMLTVEHIVQTTHSAVPNSVNSFVADVTAYVQEHYRETELNVAALARHFYVSREHLSRVFRSYNREGISHYLAELRMQEFRQGLVMGKDVLSACLESGFSDYGSFVKSFRKRYGVTPAEYRKQLQGAMDREFQS